MLKRLKTLLLYYGQALLAVGLFWLSDQVSHPDKFPIAWVTIAEVAFATAITGVFLTILRTKDSERRKEKFRKFARFLVLIVAWLVGLINQAFSGIITNLAPLLTIPVPIFQGFLVAFIAVVIGLVAGLIWIIDATRIIVEAPKGADTVLETTKKSLRRGPGEVVFSDRFVEEMTKTNRRNNGSLWAESPVRIHCVRSRQPRRIVGVWDIAVHAMIWNSLATVSD